jgi:ABC-type Na+ transport system ATPase subunit NatA
MQKNDSIIFVLFVLLFVSGVIFFFFAISFSGDQHVGKFIFQECIRGLLREKTVFFVTNQLQYLSQCDSVVFIHDGAIHSSGYV